MSSSPIDLDLDPDPVLASRARTTRAESVRGGRELPAAPRRMRMGMPHLDVGGLSESWLLRYAGDLHWEEISRQLGVASDEIQGEEDQRLYPTVVALRAHYQASLSSVVENDILDAGVRVVPCGGACAHGIVAAHVGRRELRVELLTTFALREARAGGALRMALPAARLATRWPPVGVKPELALLAKAARRGEPIDDDFCGPSLETGRAPLGRIVYEPSPYVDYNGAGLLYFASYVTIADTAERQIVRRLGLHRPIVPGEGVAADWALVTSPVRRDVFFYGNLPLGEPLTAELLELSPRYAPEGERASGGGRDTTDRLDSQDRGGRACTSVKTRVRLRRERDGAAMADVITERALVRWR